VAGKIGNLHDSLLVEVEFSEVYPFTSSRVRSPIGMVSARDEAELLQRAVRFVLVSGGDSPGYVPGQSDAPGQRALAW
jgi:hypothetical protein